MLCLLSFGSSHYSTLTSPGSSYVFICLSLALITPLVPPVTNPASPGPDSSSHQPAVQLNVTQQTSSYDVIQPTKQTKG